MSETGYFIAVILNPIFLRGGIVDELAEVLCCSCDWVKYNIGYGYGHIHAISWSVLCWLLCSEGWKVRGVVVGVNDCCGGQGGVITGLTSRLHFLVRAPRLGLR